MSVLAVARTWGTTPAERARPYPCDRWLDRVDDAYYRGIIVHAEAGRSMKIEVIALDHIYVAVRDLRVSEAFYDPVMRLLDFRKGTAPVAGEPHLHYFNRVLQYTIRPARSAARHDPYAAGLHHVCLRVQSRAEVDAAARHLRDLGVSVTEPRTYPEYDADYYATFFEDPDGIRLEIVAEVERRRLIRDHWARLTEFENPLAKAGVGRR